MKSIQQFSWDNFEKIKRLGFGGQGEVYQLREKETGTIYAGKILIEDVDINQFMKQLNILLVLSYPTLIQSYGIISKPCSFIMDYCPNHSIQYYID